MSKQLNKISNNTTGGFYRIADFAKNLTKQSSELPLAHVLVISRVVFAVVMIGFVGYFFDRIKQSVFIMESKVKAISRQV
jgi:hypothetical protein